MKNNKLLNSNDLHNHGISANCTNILANLDFMLQLVHDEYPNFQELYLVVSSVNEDGVANVIHPFSKYQDYIEFMLIHNGYVGSKLKSTCVLIIRDSKVDFHVYGFDSINI